MTSDLSKLAKMQAEIDAAGMGNPLKRENADLRAENEQLRAAVDWNVEQRGIQAREIERLRAQLRPTHTTTCACFLCLDAYGPVDARTG